MSDVALPSYNRLQPRQAQGRLEQQFATICQHSARSSCTRSIQRPFLIRERTNKGHRVGSRLGVQDVTYGVSLPGDW